MAAFTTVEIEKPLFTAAARAEIEAIASELIARFAHTYNFDDTRMAAVARNLADEASARANLATLGAKRRG